MKTENQSNQNDWSQPVDVAEVTDLLVSAAGRYFEEFQGTAESCTATPVRAYLRSNSEVYEFQLQSASIARRVIVKLPVSPRMLKAANTPIENDRPRITPRPDPRLKGKHEFEALQAIYRHFSGLAPSAFGVVRPLELVERRHLMVMEKGPAQNLSDCLKRGSRIRFPSASGFPVSLAMQHAGWWLREFHGMRVPSHAKTRSALRENFVQDCDKFWQFLEARGNRRLLPLRDRFVDACQSMPHEMRLGVVHGDYAPRNVLVEFDGKVTGFDTQACWNAPIYEDLAHFLVAVKASGLQVGTRGLAFSRKQLGLWESSFLQGYFTPHQADIAERSIAAQDLACVKLFECQRLLEWLTSLCFVCEQADGVRKWGKRCRAFLWRPYIRTCLDTTLREIEQLGASC